MEAFKGRFDNVFQKVNSAGRNFFSTLIDGNADLKHSETFKDYKSSPLEYAPSKYTDIIDENDSYAECDPNFGILAIEDGISDTEQFDRQNDREEIRKKLAMDSDTEDYMAEKTVQNTETNSLDRLKVENNLQICFLNEAAKDVDIAPEVEPAKEPETALNAGKTRKPLPKLLMNGLLFPSSLQKTNGQNNNNSQPQVVKRQRPTFFFNRPRSWHAPRVEEKLDPEEDLFTRHQKLQVQAWEALAQAKDMARMQMEIERQKKKKSPIADIVGITFPDGQNNLSRNALLDMNVAQLQIIVNDLHSQIETLNENLVKFLLERDDLHMEQDSMLVDIEDMTHNLGLKGHSQSTDSKLAINMPVNSNHKKVKNPEPIRRSQSLKKTRNFMWPLQRFSLLNRGTSRG